MTFEQAEVERIANAGWDDRITVFQYKRLVTTFAVISECYVVLIDTLVNQATARSMFEAVRDKLQTGRQLIVINTHADWDHAWGNAAFTGPNSLHPALVIGHRLCRERLLSGEAQAGLAEMQANEPDIFTGLHLEPPTLVFDEQLTLYGGDLTFELIATPGHTPDHLSIFVPEIGTLFAGDAAEAPFPFVDNAAALPILRASLAQLRALDPTTVLYCHAPGVYNPQLIRDNIAYFDTLEQHCKAALAADRIPATLDNLDLEEAINYRFVDVPGVADLDPQAQAFYHDGHLSAIQAMCTYLRTTM